MTTTFTSLGDNVQSTVGAPYTAGSGNLTLAAGYGATLAAAIAAEGFPAISATAPLGFTLMSAGQMTGPTYTATGLSGDVLSGVAVLRGTDVNFAIGDTFAVLMTAGRLKAIQVALNAVESAQSQPSAPYVMRFPGGGAYGHVNCGPFWPQPFTATGTVSATNGSAVVTGSGSKFTSEVFPGAYFYLGTGDLKAYVILSVQSDTSLTLGSTYAGSNISGSTFVLCNGAGFWWESWVKPIQSPPGYLISDGYGGAHSLLWGFSGAMTGNVNGPSGVVSYAGNYVPANGEWVHAAVQWDGNNIYTFINGVQDSTTPFTGPRIPIAFGSGGGGTLYVGGSDHSQGPMDVAVIRGWDSINPVTSGTVTQAFAPERFPSAFSGQGLTPPELVLDFSQAGLGLVPDHAPKGRITYPSLGPQRHPGRRYQASQGGGFATQPPNTTNIITGPVPYPAQDATCPFGLVLGSPLPTESVPSPATPPGGVKRYDSFGRRNQTYAFQSAPTLGSTEAGSLGAVAWNTNNATGWGILGGYAVPLGQWPLIAWVPGNSGDMDARANGLSAAVQMLGVSFRVTDNNNFWYVSSIPGNPTTQTFFLGYFASAVNNPISNQSVTGGFTTMRVVTLGTSITVYADSTQVLTATSSQFQTAQGAGLFTAWSNIYTSSAPRFKSFSLF